MPGQIPRRFARYVSVLIISWTLFSSQAFGENWPGWRGPRGDGSTATHIPLIGMDQAAKISLGKRLSPERVTRALWFGATTY